MISACLCNDHLIVIILVAGIEIYESVACVSVVFLQRPGVEHDDSDTSRASGHDRILSARVCDQFTSKLL